ncbi:MAG: hypothetical protein EOP53_02335 [Sphingobacteriales bacterium]|nr:MAG: hypothetical protein EOP53_02335 [Sphingobacteriales bacterium]
MINLTVGGKPHQIPGSWNELSALQVKLYADYIFKNFNLLFQKVEDRLEVRDENLLEISRIGLLYGLLDLPWETFVVIGEEQRYGLIYDHGLLDFFFGKNTLTKNPLPVVDINGNLLYGPVDYFFQISVAEFVFADMFYVAYRYSKDIKELDKLAAVLFRPADQHANPEAADYSGDIRQKFNRHNIESRIPLTSQLQEAEKISIFLWYDACRIRLAESFPHVFNTNNEKKASNQNAGWKGIILEMSQGDVTKFSAVEYSATLILFEELERRAVQALKMKADIENQKNKTKS